MALIQCPECTQEVSDTALTCPKCATKLRELKRGFFGKLFKWGFIIFNLVMVFWLFSYWADIGEMSAQTTDSASQTGMAIGATLGTGMLLVLWAVGDVILGLLVMFTRPKA